MSLILSPRFTGNDYFSVSMSGMIGITMRRDWLQLATAIALIGIAAGQFISQLLSAVVTGCIYGRNYGLTLPLAMAPTVEELIFRAVVACFGLGFGIQLLRRFRGGDVIIF